MLHLDSIPGLHDITVQIEFTKNGKVAYRGNTFIGYIGLPTIQRPSGWGMSADSRFNGGGVDILEGIAVAKKGGKTIGVFMRDVAEASATYTEAIQALNDTLLIAPAYFITSGVAPGEGAVVTRGREGPDNSAHEGIWSLDLPAAWWRLETNYDHWEPSQDGRRAAANAMMRKIGRKDIGFDSLLKLLSTAPVLASDTLYTTLMRHDTNEYRSIIRSHNKTRPEGPAVGKPFAYFEALRVAMVQAGMI